MLAGWNAFTHELILQCSKANPKPLVFAFFTSGEQFIQLVHGFGPMALELDDHPCNGDIGCFVRDRQVTEFHGAQLLQEPTFIAMPNDKSNIHYVKIKSAADAGAIKKMGPKDELFTGSVKSTEVTVPYFLPIPLGWVPYFLEKQ